MFNIAIDNDIYVYVYFILCRINEKQYVLCDVIKITEYSPSFTHASCWAQSQ